MLLFLPFWIDACMHMYSVHKCCGRLITLLNTYYLGNILCILHMLHHIVCATCWENKHTTEKIIYVGLTNHQICKNKWTIYCNSAVVIDDIHGAPASLGTLEYSNTEKLQQCIHSIIYWDKKKNCPIQRHIECLILKQNKMSYAET